MADIPRDIDERIKRLWCIGSARRIAAALGVSRSTVIRRAKAIGLTDGRRFWTDREDQLLRELYPDNATAVVAERVGWSIGSVHDRAARLGVRRNREWIRENSRKQSAKPRAGQFLPGQQPWNKGKKGVNGRSHTSYSPGHVPHNHKPVGHARINREGYLERKVADNTGPDNKRNFQRVHVLLWEQHHGPVPDGCIVVFKNRDKTDIRIDNLELITRSENLHRNSVQRYPLDLRRVIAVKAWVTRTINERLKREKSHDGSSESPVRHPGSTAGR